MTTQGPACSDRGSTRSAGYTILELNNPASAGFTVASIYCWAASNMSGLETGSFEDTGGGGGTGNYTCRGNCSGANMSVSAGSCVELTAGVDFVAYTVQSGEYIGHYFTGGTIERDSSGGSGILTNYGDEIVTDEENSFTLDADDENSIYCEGEGGGGGISIPVVMHHLTKNVGS